MYGHYSFDVRHLLFQKSHCKLFNMQHEISINFLSPLSLYPLVKHEHSAFKAIFDLKQLIKCFSTFKMSDPRFLHNSTT